jgi:hypothetical protein
MSLPLASGRVVTSPKTCLHVVKPIHSLLHATTRPVSKILVSRLCEGIERLKAFLDLAQNIGVGLSSPAHERSVHLSSGSWVALAQPDPPSESGMISALTRRPDHELSHS